MTSARFNFEEFTDEVWKEIPSMPTHMASSYGRIKVVPYKAKMPYGGYRQYGNTAVFGVFDKKYKRFQIIYKNKTYKVHRLVCEAFHGPPPPNKNICMHLDENSKNNKPKNLAWGTQKENLNAPGFIEYCKNRTGKNNPLYKGRNK
jgi:hypothetical protein